MVDQRVLEPIQGNVYLYCVSAVPKQDSTPQLVVALSCLNRFTESFRFHMLTVVQVQLTPRLGAWFVSLDLKNMY